MITEVIACTARYSAGSGSGSASGSGAVLVALSNRKLSVFSVWICEAMRSIVPSSVSFLRTVGNGSRFCCAMRVHFPIHFFVGDADRLTLRHFTENQRSLHFPDRRISLRRFDFVPIEIERSRIDALLRRANAAAARRDSRSAARQTTSGTGKFVRIHQFVDDLVLGRALRFRLALGENRLPQGILQFVHGAEIAEILREIVIYFGQFLAPQTLHDGLETDGFAGQFFLPVVLGIGDVEFLLVAR